MFLFTVFVDFYLSTVLNMATPSYTCITCRVSFTDPELQRGHYKTDWHRYNLKRKVAELPPVTAENFKQRVLTQRAVAEEETKHEVCQVCKKHFSSENSYTSHLRSRKHKEKLAQTDKNGPNVETSDSAEPDKLVAEKNLINSKADTDAVDSNKVLEDELSTDSDCEPEPLEISECLFCPHMSKDLEESLKHMSLAHGFFIPDLNYLADIKGLISYLCEKVGVGYMCVWCNTKGKAFHSVESVQQHMVDKCHCRLFFEGDASLEYAEYYDYTPSHPNVGEEDKVSKDDVASGDAFVPDSSLSVSEDLELVLPSGAKIGHRSMRQMYKQHLPTFEQRKTALIGRLMTQYRAIGWKDQMGTEGGEVRKRDEKWAIKMKQARETKLKMKANKMQHHFRPQVIF